MILGYSTPAHDSFGQPQTGLPVMWGLAARAQSQSTPGASALVAPHQQSFACTRRTCLLTKLLGVPEATVVLAGCGGFVTGMYLLATSPLPGVVVVLASMALLLGSVTKLSKAQEVRQESDSGCQCFSGSRAESSSR